MWQYPAEIIRWVDGDTVWLSLDLGFDLRLRCDVRLAKINTPEVVQYTLEGLQDRAREFCELVCPPGALVIADIGKADKYGRWLANIRYLQGSTNRKDVLDRGLILNDELLVRGLARPYGGAKK